MNFKPITPKDYDTLCTWWRLHGWSAPLEEALPKNGLIVRDSEGRGIAAGFLYLTDSSIAWLEFVVANPLCDKIVRDKALDTLITQLIDLARRCGKSLIFSSINHPSLVKRYEQSGGIKTDTNMTNFIWRLK
jgi:hypothetical protein